MIIFDTNHIKLGGQITPTPIDGFLILYEATEKGSLTSHLIQLQKHTNVVDEVEETYYTRVGAMPTGTMQHKEEDFQGRILDQLHGVYMAALQAANPDVGFMATIEQA